MQFQVPQFIDTEDKVVGPLSLRQFGYLGVAAAISGVLLFVLQLGAWIAISIPILGTGAALAFGKVNGRPISIYARALFQNIWAPSVYVFRPKTAADVTPAEPKGTKKRLPHLKQISKPDLQGIKDLWQRINTSKTAIPKREKALPAQVQSFSQFREKFEAVREVTGEREVAKRVDYR
jgi:hypothetical protein